MGSYWGGSYAKRGNWRDRPSTTNPKADGAAMVWVVVIGIMFVVLLLGYVIGMIGAMKADTSCTPTRDQNGAVVACIDGTD